MLDAENIKITSRNVLAQTETGSTHDVIVVGAHLDSPRDGPGINDNGTGVAAVLETALQLGPLPPVNNAVRFVFWGADEDGFNGAMDYVFGMDRDQLNDIAMYLDFTMLGSPNAGYFTDDGDQSGPPSPGIGFGDVPDGSAGIERTLGGYLNLAGKRPADLPLSTRSDYHPFMVAGVPIGGMTAGASQAKTTVQARLWGGQAGVPFDPNYQGPRDTVDAVNREALAVMGSGVAFAVGTYAESLGGVNGVPPHDKRHRTRVPSRGYPQPTIFGNCCRVGSRYTRTHGTAYLLKWTYAGQRGFCWCGSGRRGGLSADVVRSFERGFPMMCRVRRIVARLRWPEGFRCPVCGGDRAWQTSTAHWKCAGCGRKTSVTAGTIFHRTRTPLSTWFAAIWLVTSQKNGASAQESARHARPGLLRDGLGVAAQAAPGDGTSRA